jgi:hypothetical protein
MIDWCDKQCRAGNMSRTPVIVLGKVRAVSVVPQCCQQAKAVEAGKGGGAAPTCPRQPQPSSSLAHDMHAAI